MFTYLHRSILIACALALMLASCVAPAQTYDASPELKQSVSANVVPQGKARVLFSLGKMNGVMMLFGPLDLKWSADLSANGQMIGSVNYGEVVSIDLATGKYEMAWKQRVTTGEAFSSAPVSVELKEGQTVYLQADVTVTPVVGMVGTNKYTATLSTCYSSCSVDLNAKKLVVTSQ